MHNGYLKNMSNVSQVKTLLELCDFDPPLSEYTNVDEYASKISALTTRYEIWEEGQLVALVAVYLNNPPKAFITSVSVISKATGRGLGTSLMRYALVDMVEKGFAEVSLEAFNQNQVAIKLYNSLGFMVQADNGIKSTLRLILDVVSSAEK